jgi:uncharacterized protein involved in exopolysaccharide biosynthesis
MGKENSQGQIEFDLIAIVKTGWLYRKTLIISGIVGCFLGVVVSLLSLNTYSSSSLIIPNQNENASINGNIASLASFAGVNLGGAGGEALSLLMYPKLVASIPFMKEVMNSNIDYRGDSIKVIDYIIGYSNHPKVKVKDYTIGLPKKIILGLKLEDKERIPKSLNHEVVVLSTEELDVYELLNEYIEIQPDIEEGYVRIICTLYDPIPAAQLTTLVSNLLQMKITELKIEKAKADLDFIEGRFDEARGNFLNKQIELAKYKDRNKGVNTEIAKIKINQLQDEYNLLYSIYNELAKNLENARINVQEDTPVFSVIQPSIVPSEKSSMSRKVQVILWTILGGFVGIVIVLFNLYKVPFVKRWNELETNS